MTKLIHPKGRSVDVPEARVEFYTSNGWTVDGAEPEVEAAEVTFPDPEKDNHDSIDAFAVEHEVTFEGIEAKDAEKPTKAEKVQHLQKVIAERDAAASA